MCVILLAVVLTTVAAYRVSQERNHAMAGWKEAREQSARADGERSRAEAARDQALAVTGFLAEMLASTDPEESGRDVTVREVLDDVARAIPERFADAPLVEARLRNTIAATYMSLGLFENAARHYPVALALYQRELGDIHEDTLVALNGYALLLYQQGHYQEAEPMLRRTVEVAHEIYGPSHERSIGANINLAAILLSMSRYAEAEPILTRTLEIAAGELGEEHPSTLKARGALGNLYAGRGLHEEALEQFTRVAETQARTLGADHPIALHTRHNIGNALFGLGRPEEAAEVFRAVYETRKEALSPDHPLTLETALNLALVYKTLGRLDESRAILETTLPAMERSHGPAHPTTAVARRILALLLIDLSDAETGFEMLRASLAQLEERLGPLDPAAVRGRSDLYQMLITHGRDEEAAALSRRHRALLVEAGSRPDADPETLNIAAWELLSIEPADLQDPVLALAFARRACEATEFKRSYHLDTLALAQHRNGDSAAAVQTQRRALALLPENDPGRGEMEAHLRMFMANVQPAPPSDPAGKQREGPGLD